MSVNNSYNSLNEMSPICKAKLIIHTLFNFYTTWISTSAALDVFCLIQFCEQVVPVSEPGRILNSSFRSCQAHDRAMIGRHLSKNSLSLMEPVQVLLLIYWIHKICATENGSINVRLYDRQQALELLPHGGGTKIYYFNHFRSIRVSSPSRIHKAPQV